VSVREEYGQRCTHVPASGHGKARDLILLRLNPGWDEPRWVEIDLCFPWHLGKPGAVALSSRAATKSLRQPAFWCSIFEVD
jgi:hypothetical protein